MVYTTRLWAAAFNIGLSSLLFGYSIACLNTVLAPGDNASPEDCASGLDPTCPKGSILNDLLLSTVNQQLATAMTILGAMIGGLFAAYPNDHLGRRKSLLLNNAFFIVGGALTGVKSVSCLLAGRFLVGLGTGVESMIAPVLLSEIAAADTRGAITSLHQLNITLGILLSNLIGYFCVQTVPSGWRIVQLFVIAPAVLQLLLAWLVPESPRWLLRHGMRKEAEQVLVTLRGQSHGYDVEAEIAALDHELGETANQPQASWSETLSYTQAMKIGLLMMMFSALTGINSIIFYSTSIFASAGVTNSLLGTVLVGVLNVIITMLSGYLVDHLGRKILLTTGTWLMLGSLVILGITLLAAGSAGGLLISIICVGSVLLYVMGFAIGLGAVQWVVVGEVVPLKIRSKAYSLFVTSNWTANLIVSLTTLTLIDTLGGVDNADNKASAKQRGVAILYLIFAAICVLCLLFLYFVVPETKGTVASHQPNNNAQASRSPRANKQWQRQTSATETLINPTAGVADDANKV